MQKSRYAVWPLVLAMGCAHGLPKTPTTTDVARHERTFQLTYTASLANLPTAAQHIRMWIPLATTRQNQRILSRTIHADVPYEIHEELTFENEMAYVALKPPIPPQVVVSVDYEVAVSASAPLMTGQAVQGSEGVGAPKALSLALRDEPYLVVNQTVAHLAQQATAGQAGDVERARAIYDYVIEHMRYDKTTPGWGRGDTARACLLGKGNCTDFHSLFISMARAVGIPAQFFIGAPVPETDGAEIPGYHCWAEFYSPQTGWVPVDASEAWKHPERRDQYFGAWDPNKFLISVGRNLHLVPQQAGPPVNIFVYPYVEVDGLPFGVAETRFRFKNREQREART